MKIINRSYNEKLNDFDVMWYFLVDHFSYRKHHFVWPADRLGNWKYGYWNSKKCFPMFYRENAQLWFNSLNELVGFAISETGKSDFFVIVKKGYKFLSTEIIKWVKENWNDRDGRLYTEAHEVDIELISQLEAEGFINDKLEEVTREFILKDKVNVKTNLPEKFVIKSMKENPDFVRKKMLYKNGFRKDNSPVTEFERLQYKYLREIPWYNPEFDLSVLDEKGNHISTCMAYNDYKNNIAIIEKVCTHSDFRRLGLAQLVITEMFKRLYNKGLDKAYIGAFSDAAKSLYGTLGANKSVNRYRYVLN